SCQPARAPTGAKGEADERHENNEAWISQLRHDSQPGAVNGSSPAIVSVGKVITIVSSVICVVPHADQRAICGHQPRDFPKMHASPSRVVRILGVLSGRLNRLDSVPEEFWKHGKNHSKQEYDC